VVTPLKFHQDLWHPKTRVYALLYGVVCVLCLAVHPAAMDRQTDGYPAYPVYIPLIEAGSQTKSDPRFVLESRLVFNTSRDSNTNRGSDFICSNLEAGSLIEAGGGLKANITLIANCTSPGSTVVHRALRHSCVLRD